LGGLRFKSRFKGAGDESQFNRVHTKANSPFDKNCLRVASLRDSKGFLLIFNLALLKPTIYTKWARDCVTER
jgi:hypothetical protein